MKIKTISLLLMICCSSLNAKIDNIVKQDYEQGDFKLVYNNAAADIVYDQNDFKVVEIAANDLAKDAAAVSGIMPSLHTDLKKFGDSVVIVGTIGRSKIIDQLIKDGKIDPCGIAGKWETYKIQVVEKPAANIESALVIFGSDRRGTAYGVYELSKQIGVSPWYWWADVPVEKKKNLIIKKGAYTEGPPSVKYRGIFINDEGWGLNPWASQTFEPEVGNIGPKTYKKIFELLLRLKANHCWPAMHACSKAFNYFKGNKEAADDYAIVMGSAHCEPLLYNNTFEWDSNTMGQWRYDTNKENICKVLDKRISENGKFENVYTVGMRGTHDMPMVTGNLSQKEQISLLERVIDDERKILTSHINKNITEIPQAFVPYKEVLNLYDSGLKIPEDVTLMWVDDNYGYIRRLSTPLESKRSGGAGVYYHLSALASPVQYCWLYSTPPALVWEEMKKAYDFNARRIWVANVGDIKPAEYGMSFFLDLAWDVNMVDHSSITSHLKQWMADIFGSENAAELASVMNEFYALCYERKPEFMPFGEQWNPWNETWQDTQFSFVNYMEAERRMQRFASIHARADEMLKKMPENLKPAYFQLVYYPVAAADHMNRKTLLAQKNRWYAKQARNNTNELAQQVQCEYDSIQKLTDEYNNLLGGKWKHMMSVTPFSLSVFYKMPPVEKIEIPQKAQMGILLQNNPPDRGIETASLPCFNPFYDETYFIEIYNKGKTPFRWKASPNCKWIKLTKSKGQIAEQERIFVSIDWPLVPKGQELLKGEIRIDGAGRKETVYVNCFNPASPSKDELKGMFVENDGVISIYAANFNRKIESADIKWDIISDLGITGKLVTMLPITAEPLRPGKNSPHLEYDIYTFNSGIAEIHSLALPVFPVNSFRRARYGISVDGAPIQIVTTEVMENGAQWKDNIRRNASEIVTRHYIDKPGKHVVKLWMADTGTAFDKIVIDLGGLKMSYLGPEQTQVK